MTTAPDHVLEQWITFKPCQTKPLIENLARRLESDSTARSILTRLVGMRTILVTITQYHPRAFDSLCKDTVCDINNSPSRISKHLPIIQDASLAALPLFESYVELVTTMVSPRNETPEQWFRRVHRFLASATPRLLSCIPEQVVHSSLESWREQLRSSNPLNALSALDVACNFLERADDSSGSCFSSPLNETSALRQWFEKCSSLFHGEKGRSIVETTILTTLKLCSEEDPHRGPGDLIKLVEIAQRILLAVQEPVLYEWVKTHQLAIKKLAQKLNRPGMSSQMRLTSFGVLIILDKGFELDEWPTLTASAVWSFENSDCSTTVLDEAVLRTALKTLIDALDSWLGGTSEKDNRPLVFETTRCLARFLLKMCRPGRRLFANHCLCMQASEMVVNHLVSMNCRQGSRLSQAIVQVFDEAVLPDWWCLDLGISGMPENCGTPSLCIRGSENRRLQLCTEISLLMVKVSSTSRTVISPQNFSIIRQLLSRESSMERSVPCQYPPAMSAHSCADGLPQASMSSCNWQKELEHRLACSSRQTAAIVEGFVCELTKDLQSRCDSIEVPLRHARATATDLQSALERTEHDLQEARSMWKHAAEALGSERGVLNQTKADLAERQDTLFSLQQQYEESQCRHSDVERIMGTLQLEHQEKVNCMREQSLAEKTDLQKMHDLRVSEFEDQLAELHSSLTSIRDENGWLRGEMERNIDEAGTRYRQGLALLRQEMQAAEATSKKHVDDLESKVSAMEADNQQIQIELRQQKAEAEGLILSKEDFEAKFNEVSRDLQSSKDETAKLRASLIQEHDRTAGLQREIESSTAWLRQREERVAELEASERSWQEHCKSQEKALKKARKAEQRVLAIFQKQSTSMSSPVTSRASTVTATVTPTPRLLEESFVSEDDEDCSELGRVGKDA